MPRNPTTGVYEAPENSWNPAVAGTVIDPEDWAAILADISAALGTNLAWSFANGIEVNGVLGNGLSIDSSGPIRIQSGNPLYLYGVGGLSNFALSNTVVGSLPSLVVQNDGGTPIFRLDGHTDGRAFVPGLFYAGDATDTSWNNTWAYGTAWTPIQAVSSLGSVAIYGASRTSDSDANPGAAAIGVMGWAFNDSTVNNFYSWGGYFEARKFAGGGGATGIEIESTNFGSIVQIGPYSPYLERATHGLWIGAGGYTETSPGYNPATGENDLNAVTSSVAIGIINNEADFDIGLLFGDNSIAGADGTLAGGYGKAIVLAQHHDIEWWSDNGGIGAAASRIRSHADVGSQLTFIQYGLSVRDITSDATWFRVEGSATAENYIKITAGAPGNYPGFAVDGPDSDLGFIFLKKGTPQQTVYVDGKVLATTALQIGAAGTATGELQLYGTTSGTVTVKPAAVAGTYNFNLPTTAGSSGDVLTSAGGSASAMTWTGATGTGNIVKAASPTITGTLSVTGSVGATSATAFFPQNFIWNQTADNNAGYMQFRKSRGASGAGSVVQVGDSIGTFLFQGADTTGAMQNSAYVQAQVASVGAGSVTANLQFVAGSQIASLNTSGVFNSPVSFAVAGTKVIGARDTGWAAMTGTANENTVYDTASVTLPQLAGRVMALQAALTTHGLIGV